MNTSGSSSNSKIQRRTLVGAGWAGATLMVVSPAPAMAASVQPGKYVTLFDTQGADTNQNNTDATTWPHGVLSDYNPSKKQLKFQLGMQMMMFNQPAYNVAGYDTYKNWTSGPITVQLTFDNTVYKLLSSQSTWQDLPDNGGTAWNWTNTSTSGTKTTLTFTHSQIAYNGNTLGMATQTGVFEILFELLKNPGVQTAPSYQPANGRTVTNSMQVSVSSSLTTSTIPYVQENSSIIF